MSVWHDTGQETLKQNDSSCFCIITNISKYHFHQNRSKIFTHSKIFVSPLWLTRHKKFNLRNYGWLNITLRAHTGKKNEKIINKMIISSICLWHVRKWVSVFNVFSFPFFQDSIYLSLHDTKLYNDITRHDSQPTPILSSSSVREDSGCASDEFI